jgi:hypothetical protein
MQGIGIDQGVSFDLDFHTIPFHGEDALVEKHYVSKRNRKHKYYQKRGGGQISKTGT